MTNEEQNKITQLTSSGLVNLDDEDSFGKFDLVEGQFTTEVDDTVILDKHMEPAYISVNTYSRDDEGNIVEGDKIHTVWAEKANFIENLGEGLESREIPMYSSNGTPSTNNYSKEVYLKVAGPDILNDKGEVIESGLGGIKVPKDSYLTVDSNSGELKLDLETLTGDEKFYAGKDKYGLVKIGDHLYFDKDNRLTYDPYELPIATEQRVGGVKIGNGFKMTSDNLDGRSIINVNSTAYRQHLFAQQNDENLQNYQAHPEVEQLSYIVDKILDYVQQLSIKYDNCYNQLNTLMDYDAKVHGGIISGNGRFNGQRGTDVNFSSDIVELFKKYGVDDYHIALKQSSSVLGDLGAYVVVKRTTNKVPTGFTVYCTGAKNDNDEFTWFLVPKNIGFVKNPALINPNDPDREKRFYYQSDKFKRQNIDANGLIKPICIFEEGKTLPIQHGSSTFVPGGDDRSIRLEAFNNDISNTNYIVLITPVLDENKDIKSILEIEGAAFGEYWIGERKTGGSYGFTVRCSGDLYKRNENGEPDKTQDPIEIGFDWIAIPYGDSGVNDEDSAYVYDPAILPIRVGITRPVDDRDGDKQDGDLFVEFSKNVFANRRYAILCQLMSNADAKIGEYCGSFKNKKRDSFYIKYSGQGAYKNLGHADSEEDDDIELRDFQMGWLTIDATTTDTIYSYNENEGFTITIKFLDEDNARIREDYIKVFKPGFGYDFTYMLDESTVIDGLEDFMYSGRHDGIISAEAGSVNKDRTIIIYYVPKEI